MKDAILTHVDDDDRRILQRSENTTFDIPNRGLIIINESGMYALIFGSKHADSEAIAKAMMEAGEQYGVKFPKHFVQPWVYFINAKKSAEISSMLRSLQKLKELQFEKGGLFYG